MQRYIYLFEYKIDKQKNIFTNCIKIGRICSKTLGVFNEKKFNGGLKIG